MGSRGDRFPLGREIAKTYSLLGNEGTPPDFERFFLEKAVKTFFYKCYNSGIYESTPQPINGNKVVDK